MSPINVAHEHFQAVAGAMDQSVLRSDLDLLEESCDLIMMIKTSKNNQAGTNMSCTAASATE